MHKFGYTEEVLQTRLIEDIQDSYEKLETSSFNNSNEIENKSLQLQSITHKLINLEEKLINKEQIKKEIIQLLYDRGLFDSYPNKDQVFEQYLIFTDEYLLNKYGKEIKIGEDVYYLSDLNYPISRGKHYKRINQSRKIRYG